MRALILGAATARIDALREVFAIRPFAIYQTGGFAMTIGFWMQRIAIGWETWQLTGSETWLGLVAFAELFPAILLGVLGGGLADRYAAPRVMLWGNSLLALVSFTLFAITLAGLLTPWTILLMMTLVGALAGLVLPARLGMANYLAPKHLLPSALAVNSTVFNLSRFVGPAVAALLLVAGGAALVFGLATLCYLAFSVSLFFIRNVTAQTLRPATRDGASTWSVIRQMPATPVILGVIVIQFALGMLVRPASELFPAFASEVFARGEAGLGWLNAMLGLGAIAGALAMSKTQDSAAALRQIIWGSVAFTVTIIAFVSTQQFWIALAILAAHGFFMSTSNIAALAFVQINTPIERLGRVLSLYTLVFRTGPAIGAFLFGLAAESLGLMTTGILFGLAGLVVLGALSRFIMARFRSGGL